VSRDGLVLWLAARLVFQSNADKLQRPVNELTTLTAVPIARLREKIHLLVRLQYQPFSPVTSIIRPSIKGAE